VLVELILGKLELDDELKFVSEPVSIDAEDEERAVEVGEDSEGRDVVEPERVDVGE